MNDNSDECGVFGIHGHSEAANLAYLGIYAMQHRGRRAPASRRRTGIGAGGQGDGRKLPTSSTSRCWRRPLGLAISHEVLDVGRAGSRMRSRS